VTPSLVLVAPGSTTLQIQVTNVGNVTLELPEVARARLVADADVAPPLFGGGGTSGTPTDEDAVLRLNRSVSLVPGAREDLDVTVDVPNGLDAERRYVAMLPMSTATLRVVVAPTTRTSAPKRRTTAAARRSHA
jgi:hypothetical protein